MIDKEAINAQMSMNRKAYNEAKNRLEAEHLGRIALLHNGEIVSIYNDSGDAYAIACEKYGLGNFTIQIIGQRPIDLGIHTLGLLTNQA